jgi:ribonuclease HI
MHKCLTTRLINDGLIHDMRIQGKKLCFPKIQQGKLKKPTKQLEVVYTDGSVAKSIAGIGVYYGDDDKRNLSCRVSGCKDTNRVELAALYAAMAMSDMQKHLLIYTDSQQCMNMIRNYYYFDKHHDKRFEMLLDEIAFIIDVRKMKTSIYKVKGHSDVYGNTMADTLARSAPKNEYLLLPDNDWEDLKWHWKQRHTIVFPNVGS